MTVVTEEESTNSTDSVTVADRGLQQQDLPKINDDQNHLKLEPMQKYSQNETSRHNSSLRNDTLEKRALEHQSSQDDSSRERKLLQNLNNNRMTHRQNSLVKPNASQIMEINEKKQLPSKLSVLSVNNSATHISKLESVQVIDMRDGRPRSIAYSELSTSEKEKALADLLVKSALSNALDRREKVYQTFF